MQKKLIIDDDYVSLINDIKQRVKIAQLKAHRAVNTELVKLYWSVGKVLLVGQKTEKWGSKYLEQVSNDLKVEFPNMKGFSRSNLYAMRQFAELYPEGVIVQQAVGQLSWGHICLLIHKVASESVREWYAQQAIEQGWSRNVLNMMVESELHLRQKQAPKLTNFQNTLPAATSDMAQAMLKDPYCFEFLDIQEPAQEKVLEEALVDNIRDFLLHLGKGFSFVGSQYKLIVGGDEFFIDMLFFNTELNGYVVIELKTTKLSPADVGQLGFYITAVDHEIKKEHHANTIRILLCKSKNKMVAEYSLKGSQSPIGISQYELGKALTQHLQMHELKKLEKFV